MSILSTILGMDGIGAAVGTVSQSVEGIVKRFVPDPDKALEAKQELERLIAARETAILDASKAVMTADAQSDSGFTRNARPIVVYWSLTCVTLIAGLGVFGHADPLIQALSHVPDKLWDMITYGVGIFVAGRTVEKTATTVGSVVKAALTRKG